LIASVGRSIISREVGGAIALRGRRLVSTIALLFHFIAYFMYYLI